jgi:formylglycine-generating enzyme required for sulfatase activity
MKRDSTKTLAPTWLGALLLAVLLSAGCKRVDRGPEDAAPPEVKAEGGVEMVLIPGGSFEMGSVREYETDETPHEVVVDAFYLDKYEVTQEEYERVMGKNPSRKKVPDHPVDQIRWADAATYCNARSRLEGLQPAYDPETWVCDFDADGYRLPTEAEWECAARAGTKTTYSFGDDPSKLGLHAWFKRNSTGGPHAVAEKEPNPWGLCDMYGNVWEWCNDFYQEDYYQQSPARNPRGPTAGENRVVRGGCWDSKPDMCRSSYRNYEDPGYTDACFGKDIHGFVGFRCARNNRR